MAKKDESDKSSKKNILEFDAEKASKAADSTASRKIQDVVNEALTSQKGEDDKETRVFNASGLKEEMKTSGHDLEAFDLSFSANEEKSTSEEQNESEKSQLTGSEELSMKLEEPEDENQEIEIKAVSKTKDASTSKKNEDIEQIEGIEKKRESPNLKLVEEASSSSLSFEFDNNRSAVTKVPEEEGSPPENQKLENLDDLFSQNPAPVEVKQENIEESKPEEATPKAASLELDMLDISQVSKLPEEKVIKEPEASSKALPLRQDLFPDDNDVMPQHVIEEETALVEPNVVSLSKTNSNQTINSEGMKKLREDSEQVSTHYNEELIRLQSTLRNLRLERKKLLDEIEKIEGKSLKLNQENLSLLAENDELKIELDILMKRKNDELEMIRYQHKIADEKKEIAEMKVKKLKEELVLVSKQVRIDVNKVRGKEKELESQLELLRSDLAIQVSHRDKKIMELKRHIDILEFDKEGLEQREKQFNTEKRFLEEKLEKIMKALKTTMGMVETDEVIEEREGKTASLKKMKL